MRRILATDVEAAYNGDPAAESYGEVICCYPAIKAISNYRIAHELLELGVPLIPRIITEMAHSETGIDIHPGAKNRQPLHHRPRNRCRYRGNQRHRQSCQALSRRYARSQKLSARCRREAYQRHPTPSHSGGQCHYILQRHHLRKNYHRARCDRRR